MTPGAQPRLAPTYAPVHDPFLLGGAPGDVAVIDGERTLTYAELDARVRTRARDLSGTGLLALEMANDLASVVDYLAALAVRRPVLLLEPGERAAGHRRDLIERYLPASGAAGDAPATPHRDLALLLSTSGSTGSPKLVRLSRTNLLANARAIADYLDLGPTDRGITSLPLHYCYGLSVLHSHLVAGAAVVLTDRSVAEEEFWHLLAAHRVSGLAGVPYSFDLLRAGGIAERDWAGLSALRYLTQAGGRMAADTVREFAELGQSRGFDLFVMYGQTEATARMAYLPPSLAHSRPTSIGRAIPGGSLRVHRPDADGVGELVYAGPNVMMGYATTPADLARGADLTELFTGDLARIDADGLVEIHGRADRLTKVFGLRLDLDHLEHDLAALDPALRLVGGAEGDVLHVFVTRPRVESRVRAHLLARCGLPVTAVRLHRIDAVPRTSSGKVDDAALRAHAERAAMLAAPGDDPVSRHVSAEDLRDLYACLLRRPDVGPDDSFVSLGGDSLSFVELSTRLGSVLGALPREWPTLSVTELAALGRTDRSAHRWSRWSTPLEVGVVLRAVAILIVVVTHVDLVLIPGGAHLLLAVAGYHLARFTLPTPGRRARARRILVAVASVAVPSSLWIAGSSLVTGDYHWTTAVYLNGVRSYGGLGGYGDEGGLSWTLDWQFWFLEAIVWGFLALAALLCVPALDRWQRRSPFLVAAVVVAATTALRYASVGVEGDGVERYAVPSVLFVLALGWAAAEARTHLQRLAVLAASYAGLYGYFGDRQRELIVVGTVAVLLWLRPVRLPRLLATPVQVVATASLWIYLTHWQVYPALEAAGHPIAAILASLVVGIIAHRAYEWALRRRPRRGPARRSSPAGRDGLPSGSRRRVG